MRFVTVYSSESNGINPAYLICARTLGQQLAMRGIALVFDGGATGLTGALADAVIESGGDAIGVVSEKRRPS